MKYIDISITTQRGIPVWTNSPGAVVTRSVSPEKNGGYVTVSQLQSDVHTGTHIDAPRHFVAGAKTIEAIPLEKLLGKCYVVDFRGKEKITLEYCALTKDAAAWVVKQGIHLVGIDYLSIQLYTGSDETHITLLKNEVVILETINLLEVEAGEYDLICLPPRIKDLEGMAVRAVLKVL